MYIIYIDVLIVNEFILDCILLEISVEASEEGAVGMSHICDCVQTVYFGDIRP